MHAAGTAAPAAGLRALARAGCILLLLSLLTPDSRGRELGAHWLTAAPVYGAQLLAGAVQSPGHAAAAQSLLLGTALLMGAAANLTVLLRLGVAGTLASMALPWVPYLAYCRVWLSGRLPRAAAPATLLYFYPWALGIALIHAARLWRLRGCGQAQPLQPTRP